MSRPPAALTVLLCALVASADAATSPEPQIRAFFREHCIACHGPKKTKGHLRLDELAFDFGDRTDREKWQKIAEQIGSGDMPPEEEPRPPAREVKAIPALIEATIAAADAERRRTQGRVVLRRLNRAEYENTVRDLLGVDSKLRELLPLDTAADGFDNVGDALHTSSFLLDRYLEAAETALNQAIVNKPKPLSTTKRYSLTETRQVKTTGEKVFRIEDDGTVVMFCSSAWQAAQLTPFYPQERGVYRFRISASSVQSGGKAVALQVTSGLAGMAGPKPHVIGFFDVPADAPKIIEFTDRMEPKTTMSVLPYKLPGAKQVSDIGADRYEGPGVAVQWIEVEGPLNEAWPPESHRRLFGDLPQEPAPRPNQRDRVEVASKDPAGDAKRLLRPFLRRALRRPVADVDLQPFLALVQAKLAEGRSFEQAMRVAYAAVLVSPALIFFQEKPGLLDQFAVATRLSYFLWSSGPDDELLRLAETGKLRDRATLQAQVERMLKDPKAAQLTENFTGQWLGLRDIDFTAPSHLLYPEFDDLLKSSMLEETRLFFDEVLRRDLPLTNFVASDFTFVNDRLAKHYGLPGVEGREFRKVPLSPESHRGGVLTMGSVLKVTANGTNTSPVTRGAWVLDRILATPPPRPPENVAALEPDIRGATTIREQLAKHREIEPCAGCHRKIDPPGFALESFDVIGGWREAYRTRGNGKPVVVDGQKMQYLAGRAVDPGDTLADGRSFKDIDAFKRLLVANPDQLARALAIKLLTYGTGAAPEPVDRAEIERIVAETRGQNYGFRSLIHSIVTSELFLTK